MVWMGEIRYLVMWFVGALVIGVLTGILGLRMYQAGLAVLWAVMVLYGIRPSEQARLKRQGQGVMSPMSK
jgi:hypothetical protein